MEEGRDRNRRDQVGDVEKGVLEEATEKGSISGSPRNLVQWEVPGIYKGGPS